MTTIYDAGALIALERGDREMWALFKLDLADGRVPLTHGGVVGQAWRDGARQARLARALPALQTQPLDERLGRAAGILLKTAGRSDVIDAALVAIATDGDVVFTSDPDDLAALAIARDLHVDIVSV